MLRVAMFASVFAAFACGSKSSDKPASASPPPTTEVKGPVEPQKADPPPTNGGADDPSRHLHADEGTLTIDKCEVVAGKETSIAVKVAPAAGFHVSKNYPTKLTLAPPAGLKVAKTEFVAGGRTETKGDADELSEQALVLTVKATPEKAGSYEIKGTFKFGVCDKDSCHAKKQPIAIACVAT
jgi:hypothetical protein